MTVELKNGMRVKCGNEYRTIVRRDGAWVLIDDDGRVREDNEKGIRVGFETGYYKLVSDKPQPREGMRVAFYPGGSRTLEGHRTLHQTAEGWVSLDDGGDVCSGPGGGVEDLLQNGAYVPVEEEAPSPAKVVIGPADWLNSLSSEERKEVAVSRGLYAYFPDALALIARHSVRANEKHNPGQPVHWSREKSSDHEDCIARHSLSVAVDPDSMDGDAPHILCRAWRSVAALQLWIEAKRAKGETV